jgi:hypothetical protein
MIDQEQQAEALQWAQGFKEGVDIARQVKIPYLLAVGFICFTVGLFLGHGW